MGCDKQQPPLACNKKGGRAMQAGKLPYEPPTIVKVKRMRFPFEVLEDHGKRVVCKQCSSCHTCR